MKVLIYAFGPWMSKTGEEAYSVWDTLVRKHSIKCKLSFIPTPAYFSSNGMPEITKGIDKIILVYPITYRTMCGTTKMWLEKHGGYLKNVDVMGVGVAGSQRGTHSFEQDFISVMSGVKANWAKNNVLIVPGNKEDRKRAEYHLKLFTKEGS